MNAEKNIWRRRELVEEVDSEASPRRVPRWLIALGIVLAALLLIWALFLRGGSAPKKASDARPTVSVIVPGLKSVGATITAVGTLAARVDMPVGVSGEGGMVTAVLVQPGDWVRAGQVLATVDRRVQAEQSAQMAAQIASAKADAALAKSTLDRAEKLVDRGFISHAEIDQKQSAVDSANAKVKLAQAQYGEMNARLARLDIRSPSAGLVLTRAVEPGQIVSSASSALFTIAQDGAYELKAKLPEQDLARLKVGLAVQVTPVGSDRSFTGRIWQLSPVVDPTTRQGDARIALGYDPALRPGGFAQASIVAGTRDAPLLPESAVQSDPDGNFVYIVDGEGVVHRRKVKVGDVSDAGITVASGLDGNERVVSQAGAFLNPGDHVKPVLAPAG
ncbi:MAG: efflux RND transporter periplasmic adaptor subunit [Sphingomonadaceae bacterium]|nr:efflux RND transporter periplasmic adaptor subunit [Sphingomonadaceae bacterium]